MTVIFSANNVWQSATLDGIAAVTVPRAFTDEDTRTVAAPDT